MSTIVTDEAFLSTIENLATEHPGRYSFKESEATEQIQSLLGDYPPKKLG